MRILFFTADHGGCGFYRTIMPAVWINKLGLAEAYCSHSFTAIGERLFDYDSFFSGELMRKAEESVAVPKNLWDVLKALESVDVLVYQRQSNKFALAHMRTMQKAGKKVFVEHDDWLLGLATNPTIRKIFADPERRSIMEAMASEADGLIVSTEPLKEFFSIYNKNIHVCPNSMDLDLWQWPDRRTSPSIGYAGSPCHNDDFKDTGLALWRVNKKYKVKFMNFVPDFLVGYETIPGVELKDYPEKLSGAFSTGIIPLKRNEFNTGKSNLKYLEYSLAGISTIAENFKPYECIQNGVTGLLVDGNWQETMEWVMDHPDEMEAMLVNAQEDVIKNYLIQDHVNKWVKVFETEVINQQTKEEVNV